MTWKKRIVIVTSGRKVTATVTGRSETSTVIAASETDKDILEAVKTATDDVFKMIQINDETEKICTAMIIIGDRVYRCYGRIDIENMHVKNLVGKPDVIKRKFTLVEV